MTEAFGGAQSDEHTDGPATRSFIQGSMMKEEEREVKKEEEEAVVL